MDGIEGQSASSSVADARAPGPGDRPATINRAAGPALSPWVARLHVAWIKAPDDHAISCGLVADTASLRVFLEADTHVETRDGPQRHGRGVTFFGPQSRRMPVMIHGSFATVGIGFRPGACHALRAIAIEDILDRVIPYDQMGGNSERLLSRFDGVDDPNDWLDILERTMERAILTREPPRPDEIATAFDRAAFENPNRQIADIAAELGCTRRTLERIVRRDFGMSPKKVLRRARALDMAATLHGVADAREAAEVALRYYDQSHLTRDFVTFFGMTPLQFIQTPQPLMTNTLEIRQARRLEELNRIRPGERYPWRAGR